ncbi:hypothetical protein F4779DRAFT_150097 [Xylariaceae sp. FL0662B]|nr:hypothetical protein F4779DRAFT_150097 [Xylariaceae sp. FL0662B]
MVQLAKPEKAQKRAATNNHGGSLLEPNVLKPPPRPRPSSRDPDGRVPYATFCGSLIFIIMTHNVLSSNARPWPAALDPEGRFSQPSLFDNHFPRPGRLRLTLQPPNSNAQPFAEEDHSPAPTFSASESSLIPVEDYGFGSDWLQHVKEHIRNGQSCQESPHRREDRNTGQCDIPVVSSMIEETGNSGINHESELRGVGDHFGSSQLGTHATSTDDLGHDLDEADDHDIVQYLSGQFDVEQVPSKHSREEFLPFDKLFTLLRHSDIERVLSQVFQKDAASVNRIARCICHDNSRTSRRMILAILITINQVDSIDIFIQNDIYDTNLPIRRYRDRRNMILFHRRNDSDNSPPLECLRHWTPHSLDDFCSTQYRFIVPFFDMRQDHVHFYKMEDPRSTLPFLEWDIQKKGGYGTVWRARIHPAHHNYKSENPNPYFAVKEINSTDAKGYEDEVRVLERFSGSQKGHDHLIRLLMAFQHGKQYYLVFPLAQGNLVDLWSQAQRSPTSLQQSRWVIKQCLGMADGLKKIHRNFSWFKNRNTDGNGLLDVDKNRGRHGDIKPENILCFRNPGEDDSRLVISDFGLTRFHSANSVSNVPPDKVGGLSRTYRPPEFDMKSSISQAYDMWSLGCLYLEFISWFLLGYDETRDKFNQARIDDDISNPHNPPNQEDKFFNLSPDGKAVLKESVKQWITKLRGLDSCSPCMQDFLNLIEKDLLNPDPSFRSKIAPFHSKLDKIWKNCARPEYCCVNGAPSSESDNSNWTHHVTGQLSRSANGTQDTKHDDAAELTQLILDETDRYRAERRARSKTTANDLVGSSHETQYLRPGTATRTSGIPSVLPTEVIMEAATNANRYGGPIDTSEIPSGSRPSHLPVTPNFFREVTDSTFFPSQLSRAESTSSRTTSPHESIRNSTERLGASQNATSLSVSTRTVNSSIQSKSKPELQNPALYPRHESRESITLGTPRDSISRSDPTVVDQRLENDTLGGSRRATLPTQRPADRQQAPSESSDGDARIHDSDIPNRRGSTCDGTIKSHSQGKRARIKEYWKDLKRRYIPSYARRLLQRPETWLR